MHLACQLQLAVADHSALFTFLALRVRQNPQFLQRLYKLGAPPPVVVESGPKMRHLLTTRLLREIASTTRDAGVPASIILTESQWDLFDRASIEQAGVSVHELLFSVREGVDPMAIRFENDSHYNEKGHELVAELLEPIVAKLIERARNLSPTTPPS